MKSSSRLNAACRKAKNPNSRTDGRYESAYRHEWTAFWSYLNDGGPSPVSIEDGRAPVALAVAAGESARTRTPIALQSVR